MIPRIIHQTWKTTDIPNHLREFQASWRRHHPDWEYRFWTDEDNERLIAEHYPQFIDHYHRASPTILKIDFVRLAYLHRHGGMYVDLDCEALRSLDPLVSEGRIVAGRELNGAGRMMRGRDFIINALIASPARHPLCLETMDRMAAGYRPRRFFELHAFHALGRGVQIMDDLWTAYRDNHDDIIVHSHDVFYPASPFERIIENRRALAASLDSYAVHHYEDSWFSLPTRLLSACCGLWQRVRLNKPSRRLKL